MPLAAARDRVRLPFAKAIPEADSALVALLTPEPRGGLVAGLPNEWLDGEPGVCDADEVRSAYVEFLSTRLEEPRGWAENLKEACEAAV